MKQWVKLQKVERLSLAWFGQRTQARSPESLYDRPLALLQTLGRPDQYFDGMGVVQ
jgi:hypothetical protein